MKIYYLIFIILIFLGCNANNTRNENNNKELKETVLKQQETIDSLLRKSTSHNDTIASSVRKSIKQKVINKNGFNLDDIPNNTDDIYKCPVKILNTSTKYRSDFSAIGILELENNYSVSAISIELDFGISKKRINCKVPPKKSIKCSVNLTENEAKNFLTFLINGENKGLQIDKVVFSNSHMWSKP